MKAFLNTISLLTFLTLLSTSLTLEQEAEPEPKKHGPSFPEDTYLSSLLETEAEVLSTTVSSHIKLALSDSRTLIHSIINKMGERIVSVSSQGTLLNGEGSSGDVLGVDHLMLKEQLISEGRRMGNTIYLHVNDAMLSTQNRIASKIDALITRLQQMTEDTSAAYLNAGMRDHLNYRVLQKAIQIVDVVKSNTFQFALDGQEIIKALFDAYLERVEFRFAVKDVDLLDDDGLTQISLVQQETPVHLKVKIDAHGDNMLRILGYSLKDLLEKAEQIALDDLTQLYVEFGSTLGVDLFLAQVNEQEILAKLDRTDLEMRETSSYHVKDACLLSQSVLTYIIVEMIKIVEQECLLDSGTSELKIQVADTIEESLASFAQTRINISNYDLDILAIQDELRAIISDQHSRHIDAAKLYYIGYADTMILNTDKVIEEMNKGAVETSETSHLTLKMKNHSRKMSHTTKYYHDLIIEGAKDRVNSNAKAMIDSINMKFKPRHSLSQADDFELEEEAESDEEEIDEEINEEIDEESNDFEDLIAEQKKNSYSLTDTSKWVYLLEKQVLHSDKMLTDTFLHLQQSLDTAKIDINNIYLKYTNRVYDFLDVPPAKFEDLVQLQLFELIDFWESREALKEEANNMKATLSYHIHLSFGKALEDLQDNLVQFNKKHFEALPQTAKTETIDETTQTALAQQTDQKDLKESLIILGAIMSADAYEHCHAALSLAQEDVVSMILHMKEGIQEVTP